jgi:hypothetical protein
MRNKYFTLFSVFTLAVLFAFTTCGGGGDETSIVVPSAPNAATVTVGDKQLSLNWTDIPGATAYEVWYCNTNNSLSASQKGGDITDVTYSVTELTNGTLYYVWLKAKNSAGTSGFSTMASGTPIAVPTVTTTVVKGNLDFTPYIAGTSAKGGGNVASEGGSPVTERGLCWNTTGNPTISNLKVSDGSGTGVFTNCTLTGLLTNTTYYIRAYATSSVGTGYGAQTNFNSGKTFGTFYAGGYVFYNNGSSHGLVSAKTDQSTSQDWINGGSTQTTLNGNTNTAIFSGQLNTKAIMDQKDHTDSAAKVCDDYNDGTYSDWFLPSKDEILLMYVNLRANGFGGFVSEYYWSSSEDENYDNYAWAMSFGNTMGGSPAADYILKSHKTYVRAVRAF